MIYLTLFFEFFKTGLFSVGGGLSTLPFLYDIADRYSWFTTAELADMIAVSESTPGSIGMNMATYAGFTTAGVLGGVVATIGLFTPSVIIILIIAKFMTGFSEKRVVKSAFYGIRPAVCGMIAAACYGVAKTSLLTGGSISLWGMTLPEPSLIALGLFALIAAGAIKLNWHPAIYIAIAAVVGIVLKL